MKSAKVIIQKQNYKKKSKTEINNSTVSFSEPNEETQINQKRVFIEPTTKRHLLILYVHINFTKRSKL